MRPGGWRCPSLPSTGADFLLIQALSPHASRVTTTLGTGHVGCTDKLSPNTVLALPTGLPLPALCIWLPSCPHKPVSARASLMLRIVFGCPSGSPAHPFIHPSVCSSVCPVLASLSISSSLPQPTHPSLPTDSLCVCVPSFLPCPRIHSLVIPKTYQGCFFLFPGGEGKRAAGE